MKKIATLLVIIICLSAHIWAQKKAPEEKSIVNKEFDEQGNLIKYDSTYVWQWNSDSTMNFSFDENFTFGKEFSEMFGKFFNDSVFEDYGIINEHNLQPFDNEEFFQHFKNYFPDSMFITGFPFEQDSVFSFHFGHEFPGNIDFKEFENLQKQMYEKFDHQNLVFPEFKTPEQQEEFEKLMHKQEKEKQDLLKK